MKIAYFAAALLSTIIEQQKANALKLENQPGVEEMEGTNLA